MRLRIITSILIGPFLASCSPKVKKYEGTMFIVTKGRQSLNLGGSNLYIINKEDIGLHVEDAETWTRETLPKLAEKARKDKEEKEYSKAAFEEQASLTKKLYEQVTFLRDEYADRQGELEQRYMEKVKEINRSKAETYQGESTYQYYENQKALLNVEQNYKEETTKLTEKYTKKIAEAKMEAEKAEATFKQRVTEARTAIRESGESLSVAQNFNDLFCEYVFSRLPRPFLLSRTDSNGRFKFEVPADKQYALAAKESRDVIGETETYYWYLFLPDRPSNSDEDVIRIDLTNSTMLEGNYPGSVVRLPLAHFEVTE